MHHINITHLLTTGTPGKSLIEALGFFLMFIFGSAGSLLPCGLSLVVASRGYSLDVLRLLTRGMASVVAAFGLSIFSPPGSRVQAQ